MGMSHPAIQLSTDKWLSEALISKISLTYCIFSVSACGRCKSETKIYSLPPQGQNLQSLFRCIFQWNVWELWRLEQHWGYIYVLGWRKQNNPPLWIVHLFINANAHVSLQPETMTILKLCLVMLLLSNSRDVSLSKSCWAHQDLAVKLKMKWNKETIVIERIIKYHLKTTEMVYLYCLF